jgi:hypothetical protein
VSWFEKTAKEMDIALDEAMYVFRIIRHFHHGLYMADEFLLNPQLGRRSNFV